MGMIELYEKSGYLNMAALIELPVAFVIIVGGRGTGKTYGTLKYFYTHDIKPYIYLRRLNAQKDIVASDKTFSPFAKTFKKLNQSYVCKPLNKYVDGYYYADEENVDKEAFAYCIALSTFANMRGFDGDSFDFLVYDEFISEPHERAIKKEGLAFLNCYETLNRNRELEGRKPLKALLFSNAENITNPIFTELGIDLVAQKMEKEQKQFYLDKERNFALIRPRNSPISEKKKDTALYKLASQSDSFMKMAIENEFVEQNSSSIKSKNLKEYVLKCTIGKMNIYRHKSNGTFYASPHRSGTCRYNYTDDDIGKKKFATAWTVLKIAYFRDYIFFEDIVTKHTFENIFKIW